MSTYFSDPQLSRTPPVKRAAYSDRTAWIMAELSRLVYEPLSCEGSPLSVIESLYEAVQRGEPKAQVTQRLLRAIQQGDLHDSPIEAVLSKANLELVKVFCEQGTEAMLVRLDGTPEQEGMLVLVFRGTKSSFGAPSPRSAT